MAPVTPSIPVLRVLVVEDNEERIDLLQAWSPGDVHLVLVRSGGRAIRTIELDSGNVYTGIMLDHDLNEQVVVPHEEEVDGREVVRKIIQFISPDVPILIHSMNSEGRKRMKCTLETAGFFVELVPFSQMTKSRFLTWIDELRKVAALLNGD